MKLTVKDAVEMFLDTINEMPAYTKTKIGFIKYLMNAYPNTSYEIDTKDEYNEYLKQLPNEDWQYRGRVVALLVGFEDGKINIEELKSGLNYYAKIHKGYDKIVKETFDMYHAGHIDILNSCTSPLIMFL